MSYDPIHDTYVPSKEHPLPTVVPAEPAPAIISPTASTTTPHIPDPMSPTRAKAFSISSLVSPPASTPEEPNGTTHQIPPINLYGQTTTGESKPDVSNHNGTANGTSESEIKPETSHDVGEDTENGTNGTHASADTTLESHEDNVNGDKGKKKRRKYTNSTIPKCRHLKKADGEPFWRKDIQHDFLQELFDDITPAFTNVFPYCDIPSANNDPKFSFSELYIRSLVESSKCSKILKERLIKDISLGKSVSKVCLLVNAGRMNTTINFVPEMRSTLRTYHSIPSLQADPKYGGSKPLQDTPRLKSILKAVCEGDDVVKSLEELLNDPPSKTPSTNVIQIIFLLSNYNKAIPYFDSEPLDPANGLFNSFMDFFLNPRMHPKNRAKRFLWLLYTYLETKFDPQEIQQNPFGGAVAPPIEYLDDEQLEAFDKDTDYEIEYSEEMYKSRLQYLADEEHNSTPKRGNKSKSELAAAAAASVVESAAAAAAAASDDPATKEKDEDYENPEYEGEPASTRKRRSLLSEEPKKKRKGRRAASKAGPSPLTKNVVTSSTIDNVTEEIPESNDFDILEDVEVEHSPIDFLRENNIKSNSKLETINFPIESLCKISKAYAPSSFAPRRPQEASSALNRHNLVVESKPIIWGVRTSSKASTASFNKKTTILGNWVFRYFKYKKTIGNRLLGIEWEDIRYDLVNGLEAYIYQQFGRSLHFEKYPDGIEQNAEIDDPGFEYLPIHDFNHANEKNSFILQLATYCNDWLFKRLSEEKAIAKNDSIEFDLENNVVNFA